MQSTWWTGPQSVKPFFFVTLTYGSWTANRMDSLYQTVNGLVGNVDWGESLTVVACEFPGLNTFSKLWEECTQDEARLIVIEEKMGATEYQSLTIQRRSLKR